MAELSQITYPFPLRPDVIVELRIPRDLTLKEAERLSNFIESLVVLVEVESCDG